MGYRSDIRICGRKEDIKRLEEDLQDLYPYMTKFDCDQETKDGCRIIGWDSVKWYTEYEDVNAIMNFLYDCDEIEFVRTGEDYEDIECWDSVKNRDRHIYPCTYIEIYE